MFGAKRGTFAIRLAHVIFFGKRLMVFLNLLISITVMFVTKASVF